MLAWLFQAEQSLNEKNEENEKLLYLVENQP